MENRSPSESGSRVIPPQGLYFTPVNYEYHTPTPGEITIAAANPNIGADAPSNELCGEVGSCGFNSALMTITLSQVSQALAACGAHGIRPLLFHSHLLRDEKACREYVNMFKDNPNLGGWNLMEQPTYDDIASPDGLSRFYKIIHAQDPERCIFVSLVGEAEPSHMDGHTYREYMELFQDVLDPSFFPYISYPFTGTDGNTVVRYAALFDDLDTFALMSKYTERPFWACVRCMSFKSADGSVPPLTEGQLRLVVFSSLAYGAQGLVYWTYRQREDTGTAQYLSAPVDRDGNKTAVWYLVQKVNNEVKALNSVFCGADLVECRHTGEEQYRGTYSYGLTGSFGPCDSVRTNGKGALVSMLNNGGKDYLVIVNHDPFNSQKVVISFNDYWSVNELAIVGGTVKTLGVIKNFSRIIPAGSYLIFTWK